MSTEFLSVNGNLGNGIWEFKKIISILKTNVGPAYRRCFKPELQILALFSIKTYSEECANLVSKLRKESPAWQQITSRCILLMFKSSPGIQEQAVGLHITA